MIKYYLDSELPTQLNRDLSHFGETQWSGDDSWSEENFNYRLNNCDLVIYAVINDSDVVGHLGINEESVNAVFVDESFRNQGIALGLYEFAFNYLGKLYSDDAREPGDEKLWEKLLSKYPDQVSYLPKINKYLFEKN